MAKTAISTSIGNQSKVFLWGRTALELTLTVTLLFSGFVSAQDSGLFVEVWVSTLLLGMGTKAAQAWWWRREGKQVGWREIATIDLTSIFFLVASADFTVFAIAHLPQKGGFPAASLYLLPDMSNAYRGLHYATVLFILLHGFQKTRLLETGLVLELLYSGELFNLFLRPDVGPRSWLYSLTLVLGAVWLTEGLRGKREERSSRSPFDWPILAFLLAGAVTTMTSIYTHDSLSQLLAIANYAFVYYLIVRVIRQKRQIVLLVCSILVATVPIALLLLYKFVAVYRVMGMDYALRCRQDSFMGENPMASAIIVAIPLTVGLITIHGNRWVRLGLGLLLASLLMALLITYSGPGWSGLAAALATWSILQGKTWLKRARVDLRPTRRVLTVGVALSTVVMVVASLLIRFPIMKEFSAEVLDPTTGRGFRLTLWQASLNEFKDNPLTGVGLGNFYARSRYVPPFSYRDITQIFENRRLSGYQDDGWKSVGYSHSHGLFFALAEGMGILGLGAFLWLVLVLARYCWQLAASVSTGPLRMVEVSTLAGLVATFTWNLTALGHRTVLPTNYFWVLLGMAAGARGIGLGRGSGGETPTLREEDGARTSLVPQEDPSYSGPLWSGSILLAVLSLACLLFVIRPLAAQIVYTRAQNHNTPKQASIAIGELNLAAHLDPLRADYRVLGQIYVNNGRIGKATQAYKKAARLQRDYPPDHVKLGWLYWYQNRIEEAIEHFERAVVLDPWDVHRTDNHTALALAYTAVGRYDQAVEMFKEAFKVTPSAVVDPGWGSAKRENGDLAVVLDMAYPEYQRRGRVSNELRMRILHRLHARGVSVQSFAFQSPEESSRVEPLYLDQVLEGIYADYREMLSDNPQTAGGILASLADLYWRRGMIEEAIGLLKELEELEPGLEFAPYELGMIYLEDGMLEEAKREFQKVESLAQKATLYDLRLPFAQYRLGLVYLAEERFGEAVTNIEQAIANYRWNRLDGAYQFLSKAYLSLGQVEEAIAALRKEVFLQDSMPARLALGNLYNLQMKHDEAILQCAGALRLILKERRVLAINPELKMVAACMATGYKAKGTAVEEALALYKQAVAIGEGDPLGSNIALTYFYQEQGMIEDALREYQRAIELAPRRADVYLALGDTYRNWGMLEEAVDVYQRATEAFPGLAAAYARLGKAYVDMKEPAMAVVAFQRALDIQPREALLHFLLGDTYQAMGEAGKAIAAYEEGLRIYRRGLRRRDF